MTERHKYRKHERHSPVWDWQRGSTLPCGDHGASPHQQ